MFFQHPSTINAAGHQPSTAPRRQPSSTINAEGTHPSTPKAINHQRREAEKSS
jgi:hypothetical protein